MDVVLVCGPWSSGTTAVAGLLAGLGLNGLPPYFQTFDERTPNSFESRAFRAVIGDIASEERVSLRASSDAIVERLTAFRESVRRQEHGPWADETLVLKYPLSALVIPQMCRVFRTRLVYVLRPVAQIEATRRRRAWAAHTGARGAQVLYGAMFRALVEESIPMPRLVRFAELRGDPRQHARDLACFAGLEVPPSRIEEAARFVRRD